MIKDDPFIDDWTEKEYQALLAELKSTLLAGGFVYAAFCGGHLKGFVSVKPDLMDEKQTYLDLTNIHVSEEMRGQGIGKRLFLAAKEWAKKKGAKKLYLSAHSAVETQAFYKSMGCTEAEIYSQIHVEQEPFDCQLEAGYKNADYKAAAICAARLFLRGLGRLFSPLTQINFSANFLLPKEKYTIIIYIQSGRLNT